MKRILFFIVLFLTFSGVGIFAQTDSVRVRMQTSNGASISVDGDLSSTNILTKLLPIGMHEVVVTYGPNYSRTYHIDITKEGKTDFEFLVEGKLLLNSTPNNSEVIIDGLPMGKTPININILGRHNVQVLGNKDLYHPYYTTLEILPEQVLEHNAILHKRPPKLYGFVLGNYMISANAPGIMAGLGRKFGGYIKINVGINGKPYYDYFETCNSNLYSEYYKKKPKYVGINAGLMLHVLPYLFAYAGSGYGEYAHGVYEHDSEIKYDVYHIKGAELDFGVMFKYKALLLQAGYTRILAKGQSGTFGDFNIGIGVTIHKEKKR